MKEHKHIKLFTFNITVEMFDDIPEDMPEYADGGVYDEPDDNFNFKVWFSFVRGIPKLQYIAHECWHLYMTVLKHIDSNEHAFEELNNEIYAYNFQDLFQNVLDALLSSKIYKKQVKEQ